MAKNILGLVQVSPATLKVGQSVWMGPYTGNSVQSRLAAFKRRNPEMKDWEFTQRQFIFVDPATAESFKIHLVTRVF